MRINKRAVKTVLKEIVKIILALSTLTAIWYAWDYFDPFTKATALFYRLPMLRVMMEILIFFPPFFALIRTNAKTVTAFLYNVVFLFHLNIYSSTPPRMSISAAIVMLLYMMLIFVINERRKE